MEESITFFILGNSMVIIWQNFHEGELSEVELISAYLIALKVYVPFLAGASPEHQSSL